MRILKRGEIFSGKPGSEFAKTCFPWLVQLSNGELLSTFQAASMKNWIECKAVLCRSADGGVIWTEPVNPFDAAEPLTLFSQNAESINDGADLNEHLVAMTQWAYGLPSGIRLKNGELMINWYAGDETTTSIYSCVIGP